MDVTDYFGLLCLGVIAAILAYFLIPTPQKKDKDKIVEDKFDSNKFKKEVVEARLKGDNTLIGKGTSYSATVNTTTNTPSTKITPKSKTKATLDYLYACKNGLWVCPFCETLNSLEGSQCAACGRR